jgi:hypothetical protein
MRELTVRIVRWADDWQPGWVECELVDAYGKRHLFLEKGPVVSAIPLTSDSTYPQYGTLGCEIVSSKEDDQGREILVIDTTQPRAIESTSGETRFEVLRDQLN